MLLNAGVWHEWSMIAFSLAREICRVARVENDTLNELFDIMDPSMDVTYEALESAVTTCPIDLSIQQRRITSNV